jgi:hypothetical protein
MSPAINRRRSNQRHLGPVVTRSIARSASTNVAVDLYRVPAELNREAYLPHLATSMNNLANRLAEADRYERAPSWLAKPRRPTTTWLEQTRTCSDRRLSNPLTLKISSSTTET